MNIIGVPRRRVDGRAKVTGQTKFADDVMLPRMVHCKLLRSSVPHANITRIDVSRARAHPGVHLVLTGKDFPIPYGILPVSQDEYALAHQRVRFVGDPVAAVIARDETTATDALDLIEVGYEPLRTFSNPDDSLAYDEPRIHEYGDAGNIHKLVSLRFGDVDRALAGADHVFEDTFFYQGNTHLPIEQHAAVAAKDPDGKLVLWSSTQTPHYVHRALAKALAMPAAHIRVIATPNGGGFGGKSDPFNHEIVVARAAWLLDRPVKICLTREEVFYCHRGRHPVLMRLKTGVMRDGRIAGMHVQTLLDGGAYGSYGVASTFYTGALQTVTYHIPTYQFQGCRVFTNKPPCGPKRGHGTPQTRFGQEIQIDKIAEKLAIDPADFRLRIAEQPGTLTANYLRIGTIGLSECIRRVTNAANWIGSFRKLPAGRGVGLACSSYLSGAGLPIYRSDMPHSGVQLKLDRSGGVTAFCGATEIGQGSDDVLVACVAEVLGINPIDIRAVTGDTDLTPVDLGSYSSRVTLMMGNAAIQAAERVRDLLAESVARKLAVPRERLAFADCRVFDVENPETGVTFAEAVCLAEAQFGTIGSTGSYTPPKSAARFKGGGVGPSPAYSYTAAIVEVEVDASTGWVHVPRVWIAHDIGRALNPTLVRGQVEGSVYMALGEALMEEQTFRRLPAKLSHALVHKCPSMLEYKSPTTMDMPEVVTELIENPDPQGPFGAKEVGQGPLLPVMPALANAVYDAIGVRIDEVPITPEKILKALDAKAAGKTPRYGPSRFPDIAWPEAIVVPPPWEGGDGRAVVQGSGLGETAMMRLPSFQFHAPRTVREAADLLASSGLDAMLVAGGTDLLPNMKRRQQVPRTLVGLRRVAELAQISDGNGLSIGAGVTLTHLVNDARIRAGAGALWQAAAQVATPHLRNMGTLGGNLCLDTRCNYYDQNYEWRKAIDFCLKKDGSTCWVARSSPTCLAVSSTDTAPALLALGATVTLVSAESTRQIPVSDLYRNDGMDYLTRRPNEILTAIHIPEMQGWRSTYWKLRRRGAFDFPVLGVAVAIKADRDGVVEAARFVLGAVASRPLEVPNAAAVLVGRTLTDETIAQAAEAAAQPARPMDNTDFTLHWRKRVTRDFVSYALRELRGEDMRDVRRRVARQVLMVANG